MRTTICGVRYYEEQKYGAAVKDYHQAIAMDANSASFFSNLGAALFAKKEFDPAVVAYQRAMELDPDVFERTSRGGVQAQLPSPGDRAPTTTRWRNSTPRWAFRIVRWSI